MSNPGCLMFCHLVSRVPCNLDVSDVWQVKVTKFTSSVTSPSQSTLLWLLSETVQNFLLSRTRHLTLILSDIWQARVDTNRITIIEGLHPNFKPRYDSVVIHAVTFFANQALDRMFRRDNAWCFLNPLVKLPLWAPLHCFGLSVGWGGLLPLTGLAIEYKYPCLAFFEYYCYLQPFPYGLYWFFDPCS